MPQLIFKMPQLISVPDFLYAPVTKRTAQFEGEMSKNDEGSEEEVNTTDERGRRWILGI